MTMTRLLALVTLAATGIVVGLLAGYLIAIAVALIRANRNLSKTVPELERVRDNAVPLGEDLTAVNAAVGQLRERLIAVDGHLDGIARLVKRS